MSKGARAFALVLLLGEALVPTGTHPELLLESAAQPRRPGVLACPWGAQWALARAPSAKVASASADDGVVAAAMLGLRGGGARNKWRRKQNRARGASDGAGGSRAAAAACKGGGQPDDQFRRDAFQSRWQNFPRGAGRWQGFQRRAPGRGAWQGHPQSEEESFMSSREVDSEGNVVVYVDSQGNEIPARYGLLRLLATERS
jgi:hypothetical protein